MVGIRSTYSNLIFLKKILAHRIKQWYWRCLFTHWKRWYRT